MRRNKILIHDDDRSVQRHARQILSATNSECITPLDRSALKEFLETDTADLHIFNVNSHKFITEQTDIKIQNPTVLISTEPFQGVYDYLSQVETLTNFVVKGKDGKLKGRDLLSTAAKILYNDIFGINKYLGWGAYSEIYHVRSSNDRQQYIDSVLDYCKNLGLRKSFLNSIEIYCEEQIMNALFDAPRDSKGAARHSNVPRTSVVNLTPREAARIEIGSDGDRLAISVSDPFGAVDRNTILHYLDKCLNRYEVSETSESGGAGLGLFMCFNSVSDFIVNLCPEVRTEFIGVFDIDMLNKDHWKGHPSFHFFHTRSKAP